MSDTHVLKTIDQIENLPTLPVVAQQVLKLIGTTRSNMSQIAQVISKDQAIAARVVRLVNSAFYGLRSPVSSIQRAIVILGLNTVKNLVLGVSVVKTFAETTNISIFDREQFWAHTFATALGAKAIAKKTGMQEPEDFFLAGLLHDLGILTIDQFLHDEFVSILETSLMDGQDFLKAEESVLGMGHGHIGAFLAEKWGLPAFVPAAMRYHHAPSALPPESAQWRDIVRIVHLADTRSREEGIGRFIQRYPITYDHGTLSSIGLSKNKLDEIFTNVKSETSALMREWGL